MQEAKKLCPNIMFQHVATWKEGDSKWAYRDEADTNVATHKVSLDPYRMESRRIFKCIKKSLPSSPPQRVEKASVDEVFIDLSAQVHSILLERFPELRGPPPYDDPTENLPLPPTTALDWNTDALVDVDSDETEDDDPDWDDMTILIGSEIVRSIRAAIRKELKYTCSAGIARNKMIAKLGSGHKKPNQQTVVRNRAIQQFMSGFKFTKIRNLGGKLGEQVVAAFKTDRVLELLKAPLDQLKSKLDDDTGSWVYKVIRGEENSEVNSRTQIKSMLSAKSFRPNINNWDQAVRWLRIFVADIFARLVEEGVLENKRRPKTMNLHHRQGGQTKSRQIPIPAGKKIDEMGLFDLAKTLLSQIITEGRVWPCANLSLSVGGFEDGATGNRGIGSFLITGEEAKAMNASVRQIEHQSSYEEEAHSTKRRRVDDGGIQKFFGRREMSRDEQDVEASVEEFHASRSDSVPLPTNNVGPAENASSPHIENDSADMGMSNLAAPRRQSSLDTFFCQKCQTHLSFDDQTEHEDWHFAKELQASDRADQRPLPASTASAVVVTDPSKKTRAVKPQRGPRKPGGGGAAEKGQSKLAFGR